MSTGAHLSGFARSEGSRRVVGSIVRPPTSSVLVVDWSSETWGALVNAHSARLADFDPALLRRGRATLAGLSVVEVISTVEGLLLEEAVARSVLLLLLLLPPRS